MKGVVLLVLGLVVILAWSCKSKKKSSEVLESLPIDEDITILKLKSGSCRGKCKVYELEMGASGNVAYIGTKNVKLKGVHLSQWNTDEVDSLFKANGFIDLQERYLSGARDIQQFELMYNYKAVVFEKRRAPENLIILFNASETKVEEGDCKRLD